MSRRFIHKDKDLAGDVVAATLLPTVTSSDPRSSRVQSSANSDVVASPLAAAAMPAARKALKAARDCLAAKDYEEAIQHCKAALKEDSKCYEAFV